MPALDNITVSLEDLQEIMDRVRDTRHTGPIKIIDTINSYTVRDTNEMFIVDVMKRPVYEEG
jgi:hypothetical protein